MTSTTITAADRDTGMACSFVTGTKECDAYVARCLTNFIDRLRHTGRVELWSDTEFAPISIIDAFIFSLELENALLKPENHRLGVYGSRRKYYPLVAW
jgi:hypothetical protein